MQNTSKDGSSMVGMDQCRISSIESTASSLLEGGTSNASSARCGPQLYSQKSRGSHSSAGSCGGQEDSILLGGGVLVTEAEPLLPVNFSRSEENKSTSAHVNKLHFQLFDQCQDDTDTQSDKIMEGNSGGVIEGQSETKGSGEGSEEDGAPVEPHVYSNKLESDLRKERELVRMKNASNDTVCTSSSSSTAATATAVSSKSSRSASAVGNNNISRQGRSSNNKNKRLRHASTDTDETSEISATLEPPDGAYGWVVVAASFLVNLIADGVTFSFGVFFMEFTTYFKQSESTTAWIGSLLAAMPLLSGPIASYLTDRYGCRKVTIVGGLLAAIGFVLSSYTTSIYVLMLTFGVITGFGLSLCYVAAVVIVAYYFERRRSFATGLSVCGGGIGTFLFAPLSTHLIERYGWQTTTMVLAGTFLILCLCGLLMKDLEWSKKKNKSSNNNNSNSPHSLTHHGCNGNNFSCSNQHRLSSDKLNAKLKGKNNNRRCNSAICIPTFVQEQERRERRQRYYSCNQDADANGGVPVKPDLIVIDKSSPGSIHKARNIKTKILPLQKDQIDSADLLLGLGPATLTLPDRIAEVSSKQNGSIPFIHSSCVVIPSDDMENSSLANDNENIQEPLLPIGGDLNIIPEEKDTSFTKRPITAATGNDSLNNGENMDMSFTQHRSNSPSAQIPGNVTDDANRCTSSILPTVVDQNVRNIPLQSINNNNYGNNKCPIIGDTCNTAALSTASSGDLFNHIYHHNANCNNDSNNSSINNVNNINNSLMSNGLVRNNSGSHFIRNNNSSVSSFTTTTTMPNAGGAPNGVPTIIIPPAQQSKQSSSAKLDVMNSARYRSVMHRHSLTYRGAVLNLKRYRLRPASSCPDIISVATSVDGRDSFELNGAWSWMHGICEWDNFINTRFLLFILSNLLLYTWYDVPYMYLQTAAVRHGYSEELSSYLISSIGLSNVVGNIILGYMGDKEWASATIVYGVCMIICGGTTCLMPYLMEASFWGLFVICGVFGLTIAANYALTSVILVQVVSLERFASAYGLLLLVQGIGNLVGPPIAGVISDRTGNNTLSFIVAGVGIFASSFFVLAPIFQRELESESTDHQTHVSQVGHNETV